VTAILECCSRDAKRPLTKLPALGLPQIFAGMMLASLRPLPEPGRRKFLIG